MILDNINSATTANASYKPNSTTAPIKEETGSEAQNVQAVASQATAANNIKEAEEKETDASGKQSKEVSDATVRQALQDVNRRINHNTVAEFGLHEGTNRIMIKLKDKDTNKVIKEVPAEKTLDLIQKAWELAGILVDEKR